MFQFRINNVWGEEEHDGAHRHRLGGGRFTLPSWVFYPVVALLSLWVFAYVSGLFPYFGYKAGGYRTWDGPVASTSYGVGDNDDVQIHYGFLFAGQTAIVDYDLTVRKGALEIELTKGVNPLAKPLLEQKLTQSGKGRIAVKVPSTGVYSLYFMPTYASSRTGTETDISYTLWWGGLF